MSIVLDICKTHFNALIWLVTFEHETFEVHAEFGKKSKMEIEMLTCFDDTSS